MNVGACSLALLVPRRYPLLVYALKVDVCYEKVSFVLDEETNSFYLALSTSAANVFFLSSNSDTAS